MFSKIYISSKTNNVLFLANLILNVLIINYESVIYLLIVINGVGKNYELFKLNLYLFFLSWTIFFNSRLTKLKLR